MRELIVVTALYRHSAGVGAQRPCEASIAEGAAHAAPSRSRPSSQLAASEALEAAVNTAFLSSLRILSQWAMYCAWSVRGSGVMPRSPHRNAAPSSARYLNSQAVSADFHQPKPADLAALRGFRTGETLGSIWRAALRIAVRGFYDCSANRMRLVKGFLSCRLLRGRTGRPPHLRSKHLADI